MIPCRILTQKGVAFDGEVDSVLIPAVDGPLLLEKGYTPSIVACVKAGVLKITREGKASYYAFFDGVAHVRPDSITLLCESLENGYEIDMARAIAKRDRNLDLIRSEDPNADVAHAKASLEKQLARIKAKTLGEGGLH